MAEIYSIENPLFTGAVFYAALVLLKLIAVSLLVTYRRVTLHVYSSPEDCTAYAPEKRDLKPIYNDELVERARRNHANDLENIPLFVLAASLYIATNPALSVALMHFRIFVVARYLHTFAYQVLGNALMRTLSHVTGMMVTVSMVVQTLLAFM